MMYLQDVAKMCADDYNLISPGAMQYTEVRMLQGFSVASALSGLFKKSIQTSPTYVSGII